MPPKIAHDRRVCRGSKFCFTENLFFQKEFQYLLSIQIKCVAFLSKVPQDFGKVTGPENCSCFSFEISMNFFLRRRFHFIHRKQPVRYIYLTGCTGIFWNKDVLICWYIYQQIKLHCSEEYRDPPSLAFGS